MNVTTGSTVLITGSSGRMGTALSADLASKGFKLRLFDLQPHPDPPEGAVEYLGRLEEPGRMEAAVDGVDAVIHLAALPNEDSWAETVSQTVNNTELLLRSCASAGVGKILLASSHHVAGFYDKAETLPADVLPRPDTYYGVAKATVEAMGSLYHHRFGMDVLALRIGSCFSEPHAPRSMPIWLSPRDMTGIVLAWLSLSGSDFRVAWGVSNNSRGFLSTKPLLEMGYSPRDNSEDFLARLTEKFGADAFSEAQHDNLGGPFCTAPLGQKMEG